MGLNSKKCDQRRRIDGLRYEIEAIPIKLVASEMVYDGPIGEHAIGSLPKTKNAALQMIQAMQPEGAEPLAFDDIYIHFGEAANSNFIPDRFGFLDQSTLKNIAQGAAKGVSFMGNHATGTMCAPGQFAIARTFAGRFEKSDQDMKSLFGVYMIRGVKPNGENGPSTDDLDRMLRGGQLFDVSVGLHGGDYVCDVCGNGLFENDDDGYLCDHWPGSTRGMSSEEIAAQKGRGVPNGAASYTLVGAELGEISAVYDGAVPGAGIRKSLALARGGGVMDLQTLGTALREHVTEPLMAALGKRKDELPDPQLVAGELVNPKVDALEQTVKSQQELIANMKSELDASRKITQLKDDKAAITSLVRQFKMTPVEGEQWEKIATDTPEHFAAAKPVLEARTPLPQISGIRLELAPDSPAAELDQMVRARMEKDGITYDKAAYLVSQENPGLSSRHRADVQTLNGGGPNG